MATCSECGAQADADARFCPSCGSTFNACASCGFANRSGDRICTTCGRPLDAEGTEEPEAVAAPGPPTAAPGRRGSWAVPLCAAAAILLAVSVALAVVGLG